MSTSTTPSWLSLSDDNLTPEIVKAVLAPVQDDIWVVSACVDRISNDTAVQHSLLALSLSRTERAVQRCTDVVAVALKPDSAVLVSHFQNTPADALFCHLRAVLLRRLDRLNTYVEMEKVFQNNIEIEVEDDIEEWEDDPWGDGGAISKPAPRAKSTSIPLLFTLSDFLEHDLLWSACQLATLEAFDALHILQDRHAAELWPARLKIQNCIPEHIHPTQYPSLFPSLDLKSNFESINPSTPWRTSLDFSELSSTQQALRSSGVELPAIPDSNKALEYTPVNEALSPEDLSNWYKDRAQYVIVSTGMIDIALALVQHAASQGIPSLDELGEELSLLSKLVYEAPQGDDLKDDWTLELWNSMDPPSVVRAYLAHASPDTLARCISHLVLPYLYVLEAKAERAQKPEPGLPTQLLYDYILSTSLENVAAIFDASKPTLLMAQRIVKDDEDMVRLSLACLYSSDALDQWPTMSSIFECLPVWDIPQNDDVNSVEAADTTITSLGAFVTPNTNQPRCTAQDLMLFLQPLRLPSLSRLLDILDVHLESGEILSRWGVPAPLRWFLQSSDNIKEQRAWANRMARRAGGQDDKLNGIDDWEWLLTDMLKLTGNGDSLSRSAFSLLSTEEVSSIFLSGLLSTGNFEIAKSMLYGSHHKLDLTADTVEEVCLSASREFYDNASSGNYTTGDMKLAYECLNTARPSEKVTEEKEFIEATSRISSFNVSSGPGIAIAPIEIRLTKDKLTLVSSVLSSTNDAYKHTQVILDLGNKLGYKNDIVARVKILAMLADTALQAEDFARAYENCEHMVQIVSALRNTRPSELDDAKAEQAAEVCWIACFQLGRQSEFDDLPKKLALLGRAIEFCPADKIHDVLIAWRRVEEENIAQREAKLANMRTLGDRVAAGQHEQKTAKSAQLSNNVASSLRAKLHDFHMLSPPLLSTPDAAALATRTFKSVAANFPFGGTRSHTSDMDERSSTRSDNHDVSSQASRVLSKGIGWLIGADDEL